MAGPERAELRVETTRQLKRRHLADDDHAELDALDGIVKRIKAAVSHTPYILSTPSLNPYRYRSQQEANAWIMGRLFKPDEEHLQYRTYVYREPCQDCLELQAGEDDEPEPLRPESRPPAGAPAPKKKLNLANFKVKHANGTVTPAPKKPSPPPLAPASAQHEHANGVPKRDKQDPKHPDKAPQSCDERKAATAPHDDASAARPPRSPPPKDDLGESRTAMDKAASAEGTPHGLPPLLSPVHIPSGNPYGLPDILSPTLPSTIQAELDKIEQKRKRAESSASSTCTHGKMQPLAPPSAEPQKPVPAVKTEPRIRSVSINGKSPHVEPVKAKEQSDPSLVVKFKFSKAKVSTVTQLLKLAPKRTPAQKKERQAVKEDSGSAPSQAADEEPKKKKPMPKVAARRPDNATPVAAPLTKPSAFAPATKVAEKRPRADDDAAALAIPSKRARAASALDRPHTPVQQAVPSPSVSTKSSAQKVQPPYATPKNSIKASSMLRTASTESNDSTPGRSVATPVGVKTEAKAGPTSAPLTDKKQAEFTLLNQTSMKLNQMGRALKHEATKILMAGGGKAVPKQEEKRAAVTNMECILSYMAAYHAQDTSLNLRGRAGEVEGTWKTLLPLCLSYARSTKEFKHLDGLRSYLSSVIASAICTHVAQRCSSSARPHDSPHDLAHSDLAKQHASMAANFALLSDHTMKMNQHYQDARIALPAEDIQSMYKKTFAGREMNARIAKEPEKIHGARMSGPYFLPLSNDTTPIQAVRFGLKFLAEFCEKEKLDYSLRVNLDSQ
ncbi:hypothetical protein ACEQ8H_006291 [Pleosporales sp. CAS-2024a]